MEAPPLTSCRMPPWGTRAPQLAHITGTKAGLLSLRLRLLISAKLSFSLTSVPPHPPQYINVYLALVSTGGGGFPTTTHGVLSRLCLTVGVHSTLRACEGRRKGKMIPGS